MKTNTQSQAKATHICSQEMMVGDKRRQADSQRHSACPCPSEPFTRMASPSMADAPSSAVGARTLTDSSSMIWMKASVTECHHVPPCATQILERQSRKVMLSIALVAAAPRLPRQWSARKRKLKCGAASASNSANKAGLYAEAWLLSILSNIIVIHVLQKLPYCPILPILL